MGARSAFVQAQLRRAFTLRGIAGALRNPGKVLTFLRSELLNVKYNETPLIEQISVLRNSLRAMAQVSQVARTKVAPITVEDFVGASAHSADTEELRALFQKYG